MLQIPPELKKISAFVRRAEELDKDQSTPESRLVAYYCRQCAVHTGIPLASSSMMAKQCLGSLLETLEAEKPAMDNFTRDEAKYLCKAFAEKVFNKADEEDRSELADKGTAKTFYAAATFLQILDQFASESDDTAELEEKEEIKKKVIYAKWKATEILKAIRAGVKPTPGGYGEDQALGEENTEDEENVDKTSQGATSEGNDDEALPPPPSIPPPPEVETVSDNDDDDAGGDVTVNIPSAPTAAPMEPPTGSSDEEMKEEEEEEEQGTEVQLGPPPAYPGDDSSKDSSPISQSFVSPPPASPPSPPQKPPTPPPPMPPKVEEEKKSSGGFLGFGKKKAGKLTKVQMNDALELTRFAMSALEEKDADLAAERLQQALKSLGR